MDKAVLPGNTELETALGNISFMVAFVFGQKAFNAIMDSEVSDVIKRELSSARVYAEGRGIRIPVPDQESLKDIFTLLKFKLAN